MIDLFLFLLQLFLKGTSILIFGISIIYICALIKFIYNSFDSLDKDAEKFGFRVLFFFSVIATVINLILFNIIW